MNLGEGKSTCEERKYPQKENLSKKQTCSNTLEGNALDNGDQISCRDKIGDGLDDERHIDNGEDIS